MSAIHPLLTGHLDIWTAAETEKKSGRGRSGGNGASVYGIKKLRELILELAMRGKLVPQDPDDEPAGELLKRIQAEKAKLMVEGKIKKDKPLPPISDEEKPFELPRGWEWVRLGDISSTVQYGYTDSANHQSRDVLLLRITDIQDDAVNWATVPGCNISLSDYESYELKNNDLAIARTGGTIGKSYLVTGLDQKAVFASYLIRIGKLSSTSSEYKKVFLGSVLYWKQLIANSMGTGQPNVNGTALKSLIFPLPPLAEQHRIVAKVDELMALCDQLETQHNNAAEVHEKLASHLLGTLTQSQSADDFSVNWQRIAAHFDTLFTTEASIDVLKQTLLQLAVMGKLVPQDPNDEPASELLKRIQIEKTKLMAEGKIKKDKPLSPITDEEKPFELPQGWKWFRIGSIGHDWGQKTPDSDFTYIEVSAIDSQRGIISSPALVKPENAPSRARKVVKEGTVIYSTIRPYLLNIAVIEKEFLPEPIASTAFAIVHPFCSMPPRYFLCFFRSPVFVRYVESVQMGIAYPAINDGQFFSGLIPLPPIEEQHRIVAKIDELMTLCDQLKSRITQASQLRQKLADAVVEQAIAS